MHTSERIRGGASDRLTGMTVALAVTGSIAAIRTVELARDLARHGAEVRAYMSEAATRIIHPDALAWATGQPVVTKLTGRVEHLAAHQGEADAVVVAPATANSIAKMALGIDDSVPTSLVQATMGAGDVPIIVAPAMHEGMLGHPVTADHVQTLRGLGVVVVEPRMAEAEAKLADNEAIVEHVIRATGSQRLRGKRVLVINGSTIEPIDEMRVMTNKSTGRTGIALAVEAFRLGADVEVWFGHGHTHVPPHLPIERFVTVEDLLEMVPGAADHDLVLVPAAISDFRAPEEEGKRPSSESLTLELEPTPKVLKTLKETVTGRLVGFKAESGVTRDELLERARVSMDENGLDAVVANDLRAVDVDDTVLEVLLADDVRTHKGDKTEVARAVLMDLAEAFFKTGLEDRS